MDVKLETALNNQIQAEFDSSYLYLSMAGYLESENWPGMAKWMYLQAEEEREHGMKIFQFLLDRGSSLKLLALSEPQASWGGPLDVFKGALAHEEKITELINDCMDIAMDARDHAARGMLDWFVKEQIEEEAVAGDIVGRMERVASDAKGLLMMDAELGQRQPKPVSE